MDPVIVASARKHGIPDEDMLHAYRNPIRVFELDDLGGAEGIEFIVHAMPARDKFLR
jgi:hypothetical protein